MNKYRLMLPETEKSNPDAIETYVVKKISEAPLEEMSNDDMDILTKLLIADKKSQLPEKEKFWQYKIIEKRLSVCFTFKIPDSRLIMFLVVIAQSPGCGTLYLWYLQSWCKKHDVRELYLEEFCQRIFPNGFPSQKELSIIWEGQKVTCDGRTTNLVDCATAGANLQFEIQPQ